MHVYKALIIILLTSIPHTFATDVKQLSQSLSSLKEQLSLVGSALSNITDETPPTPLPRDEPTFETKPQTQFVLKIQPNTAFDQAKPTTFTQTEIDSWIQETITQDKPFANLTSEHSVTMMQLAEKKLNTFYDFLEDSFSLKDALLELQGTEVQTLAPIVITKLLNIKNIKDIKEVIDDDDKFKTLRSKVSQSKERLSRIAKSLTDPTKNRIAPSLSFLGFHFLVDPTAYQANVLDACFTVNDDLKTNSFEIITYAWQQWLENLETETFNLFTKSLKLEEIFKKKKTPLYLELKKIYDEQKAKRGASTQLTEAEVIELFAKELGDILYTFKQKLSGYKKMVVKKTFIPDTLQLSQLSPVLVLMTLSYEKVEQILNKMVETVNTPTLKIRQLIERTESVLIGNEDKLLPHEGIVHKFQNKFINFIQQFNPSFTFDYESFANTVKKVLHKNKPTSSSSTPQDGDLSPIKILGHQQKLPKLISNKLDGYNAQEWAAFKKKYQPSITGLLNLKANQWLDITLKTTSIETFKKYYAENAKDRATLDAAIVKIDEKRKQNQEATIEQQRQDAKEKKKKEEEKERKRLEALEQTNKELVTLFDDIKKTPSTFYLGKTLFSEDAKLLEKAMKDSVTKTKLAALFRNLKRSNKTIFEAITKTSTKFNKNPFYSVSGMQQIIKRVKIKRPLPPTPTNNNATPPSDDEDEDTDDLSPEQIIATYKNLNDKTIKPLVSKLANLPTKYHAGTVLSIKKKTITTLQSKLSGNINAHKGISQKELVDLKKLIKDTQALLAASKSIAPHIKKLQNIRTGYKKTRLFKRKFFPPFKKNKRIIPYLFKNRSASSAWSSGRRPIRIFPPSSGCIGIRLKMAS